MRVRTTREWCFGCVCWQAPFLWTELSTRNQFSVMAQAYASCGKPLVPVLNTCPDGIGWPRCSVSSSALFGRGMNSLVLCVFLCKPLAYLWPMLGYLTLGC